MNKRESLWKLRKLQQAQPRVLIRMPKTPNNAIRKEQHNEKATPKQTDATSDMRDAIRTDFAVPTPVEKRGPAELDALEMAALRKEALNYTRPFEVGEGRPL